MKITEFKTSSPIGMPELLSEIEISPELKAYQDEMPSDESIDLVKESIKENGYDQTKPIECYQDPKTGRFYVLRGWTRYTACNGLGLKTIPVITLDIPKDKREDFVIQDNTARRQMTAEQKKVIARKVLKNSPQKSDLKIGSITGLSDKTIKNLREEMKPHSENPNVPKTDSLGRNIPERKPRAKSSEKRHSENPNVDPTKAQTSQNQNRAIPKSDPIKPLPKGSKRIEIDLSADEVKVLAQYLSLSDYYETLKQILNSGDKAETLREVFEKITKALNK